MEKVGKATEIYEIYEIVQRLISLGEKTQVKLALALVLTNNSSKRRQKWIDKIEMRCINAIIWQNWFFSMFI